jgi:hypothetical protein
MSKTKKTNSWRDAFPNQIDEMYNGTIQQGITYNANQQYLNNTFVEQEPRKIEWGIPPARRNARKNA